MQPLLVIVLALAFYDQVNGADRPIRPIPKPKSDSPVRPSPVLKGKGGIDSIPEFKVEDADLIKLVNSMRQNDNETAGFCDVHLNYGVRFTGQNPSKNKLFAKVNEELLKKGTFAKLLALRKYYNPQTGETEVKSPEKDKAINEFYDAVWNSEPFKLLVAFLKGKRHDWTKESSDPNLLKNAIKQIWFDEFSRAKGKLDSSAFEHVFFGEIKNDQVSGMHNWAVMYDLEKNQAQEKFQYKGFYNKHYDVLAEVNLFWRGFEKPKGSFFANSSPAFDFSVLTACFLTHRSSDTNKDFCNILVDGCNVQVQSYDLIRDGKVFIGTSYPQMGRPSKECDAAYKKKQKCC